MARVYKTMGEPVAETPYLIWCSDLQTTATGEQSLAVDQLAIELLECAISQIVRLCAAVS